MNMRYINFISGMALRKQRIFNCLLLPYPGVIDKTFFYLSFINEIAFYLMSVMSTNLSLSPTILFLNLEIAINNGMLSLFNKMDILLVENLFVR